MALLPITPVPGIVTNGTPYSKKGRWTDGDLVRFQNGNLKPIGGWEKLKPAALTGTPTALYAYSDNFGNSVLAVGTRQKVYVLTRNIWYDITPTGFTTDASNDPLGYGAYQYGQEDYGDARSQSGLLFDTTSFSFDNWGEFLIFCSASDGKIYQWRPHGGGTNTPDSAGTAVTNAPTGNLGVVVTNERHILAIGAGGDPRKVSWCSREDQTNWTAKATNTAGDLQVPTGGRLIGAKKFQTDVILFTDTGIARLFYNGNPFVYGVADAGTNCKAISTRSIASSGNALSWVGENAIFVYDGRVQEVPCEVHDYIFSDLNYSYRKTIAGGHNSNYNEFIWFFPSTDSQKPDKYIIWNYMDNVWAVGAMDRGCWVDQGVFDYPIACDNSGFVYQHESTTLDNSPNLGTSVPFCQSGPIEISNGDRYVQCNQIIPDSEASTLPGVTLSFTGKFTPLGPETDFGSFTFDSSDGYTDARFSARQVQMKVTGDTTQDFELGNVRLDVVTRGRR